MHSLELCLSHRQHKPLHLSAALFNAPDSGNNHTSSGLNQRTNLVGCTDERLISILRTEMRVSDLQTVDLMTSGRAAARAVAMEGHKRYSVLGLWLISKDSDQYGHARLWHECHCGCFLLYVIKRCTKYKGESAQREWMAAELRIEVEGKAEIKT